MRPVWLAVAALVAAQALPAQELSREDREYGIGVVAYPTLMTTGMKDVIRAAPSLRAAVVARLDGDTVCFAQPRGCSRSWERMIEYGYEEPGWAILRFSPDSLWAEVSLGAAQRGVPTGWVRLRPDSTLVIRWDSLLAENALFFLREGDIAFYSRPDTSARINRALARHREYDRLSYIMYPVTRRGRWLRVVLESPSNMCVFPEVPTRRDTLWIRYLTPAGRPNVFFHTRGC